MALFEKQYNFETFDVNCGEFGIREIEFEVNRTNLKSTSYVEFVYCIFENTQNYVNRGIDTFIAEGAWSEGMSREDVNQSINGISFLLEEDKQSEGKYLWHFQISLQSPNWDTEYGFFMEYSNFDFLYSTGAT